MAGPSLTMKTAPLLHRNVSEYTYQCDQGNITVVVCVIRISLYNKDRRFSGESAKQGSVVASWQTLLHISPRIIDPVYIKEIHRSIGASYVNCKHETFETWSNDSQQEKIRTRGSSDPQEHPPCSNLLSVGKGQQQCL
jgi:hypothetical protein